MSVKIIIALSRRNSLAKDNEQTGIIRKQVARMLITNNAVFFLLHGPFQVMNIIRISQEHLGYDVINMYVTSDVMLWVGRVGAVANSAVNPVIYNVTNPRYRQAFLKCFGCGFKAEKSSHGKITQLIQISATDASSAVPQQAV